MRVHGFVDGPIGQINYGDFTARPPRGYRPPAQPPTRHDIVLHQSLQSPITGIRPGWTFGAFSPIALEPRHIGVSQT